MSSKDDHLYKVVRPNRPSKKAVETSNTSAFASQLSSLIASSSSSKAPSNSPVPSNSGRPRPEKKDIFSAHNRNVKKRALKDLQNDDEQQSGPLVQKHSKHSSALDDRTTKRTRRNMEEKARLYAALKRGDVDDADGKYGVDFDRKFAEAEARGDDEDTSSGEHDDDEPDTDDEVMVDYKDEFGRDRRGKKRQAERERYRIMAAERAAQIHRDRILLPQDELQEYGISGAGIQTSAFKPDAAVAEAMEQLAALRDEGDAPPEDTHFDERQEVRVKGTGFFRFSQDKEERRKQQENLEREREETKRRERWRGEKLAEGFLSELGREMDEKGGKK
ncbi:hypothetical protein K402DRAFT_392886 [Aulographum hederae CBS 113979]|uniref:Uncharacterized protein n=1 Tax=Aulographum hederae CBS 113979 TaxID=1176131 RepID=A0A6G1H2A8_9PEZI|nr:hypothetical protein K402DRAFT_392886 [Aulographum hederae CBS 113979]